MRRPFDATGGSRRRRQKREGGPCGPRLILGNHAHRRPVATFAATAGSARQRSGRQKAPLYRATPLALAAGVLVSAPPRSKSACQRGSQTFKSFRSSRPSSPCSGRFRTRRHSACGLPPAAHPIAQPHAAAREAVEKGGHCAPRSAQRRAASMRCASASSRRRSAP